MKSRRAAGLAVLGVVVGLTMLVTAGAGAKQTSASALPRAQTLYMSGNQWSPNNDLNPAKNWDYVTGLVGFVYETPFRYDPLKDKFIPWLATSGKWTSKTTYAMTIRKGVKWSDGKPLTPADVKYSFDLAKIATHPQHPLWADTGLKSTKVVGQHGRLHVRRHARATSSSTSTATTSRSSRSTSSRTTAHDGHHDRQPRRHEEDRRHRARTCTSRASARSRERSSGRSATTGGRRRRSASRSRRRTSSTSRTARTPPRCRTCSPATSTSSTTSRRSRRSRASSRPTSQRRPYHLGANTTWLFPNTTKKPLNDKQFRRALAFSINMNQILDKAYQGLVNKASPTGLLPIWNKWIDKKVVKQYGFSYNAAKAKAILAAAGYKDTNGDGYVENKDGSKIDLKHRLPERVVRLDDRRSRSSPTARRPSGSRSRRRSRSTARWSTTAATANYDLLLGNDRQYQQHAVDVLPVHLPAADPRRTRRRSTTSGYTNQTAWNLDEAAGQDAVDQHQGATRP